MTNLFFYLNKMKYHSLALKIKQLILKEESIGNNNEDDALLNVPNSENKTNQILMILSDKGDMTDCGNNTNDKTDEMMNENNDNNIKNQKENSIISSTKSEIEESNSPPAKLRLLKDDEFIFVLKHYFTFEYFEQLVSELNQYKSKDNDKIKHKILRRAICLKMFKILSFLLKDSTLVTPRIIKKLIIQIEKKGREYDETMEFKYKLFMYGFYHKLNVSIYYNKLL